MATILVDFQSKLGKIKPMHAVNNGPIYKFASDQRITNIDAFKDAGIPYARNHDASFCSTYGGEHTVDVNNIFTNFDSDPYNENSYDFTLTDEYVKVCEFANVRTFYRLGSKIEHWSKKYNTLPPKDFKKWAIICEHIIRHYTQGWAKGFYYDIKYWEIWNEPELDKDDSTHKRTWGGTAKEFYELYTITHKHLKSCFPNLKIGGPSVSKTSANETWLRNFFKILKENDIYPDFFSWHCYTNSVEVIKEKVNFVRNLLDEYGFKKTESILNEWNYVKGWIGDDWIYSKKTEKNLKGSSFIASVMESCQNEPLDMLMYYDARPGGMNGMFSTDLVCEKLKGYYPFYMFNQLYKLDNSVKVLSNDNDIYACASVSENEGCLMITHYSDNDDKCSIEIEVELLNFGSDNGTMIEYYLLDENNDANLINKATYFGNKFCPTLKINNFSTYLIKVKKLI